MRITTLVENTATNDLLPAHGLSFLVETPNHTLLFDLGPNETIFKNARRLGVDLGTVDTVVLSHGHYDHGGPLGDFLELNKSARVYVQESAFLPYYNVARDPASYIGIDSSLATHPQVEAIKGDLRLDDELLLFCARGKGRLLSPMNYNLHAADGPDDFSHEQNLLVSCGDTHALLHGCGHRGIVNILDALGEAAPGVVPAVCAGGYHLWNPTTFECAPDDLLAAIAADLTERFPETDFYTCHCTGEKPFEKLSALMPNLRRLSGGDVIEI